MENTTRTFQLSKDYDSLVKKYTAEKAKISKRDFIVMNLKKEIEITKSALLTWSDASKKTYKEKYKAVSKKLVVLENELAELN